MKSTQSTASRLGWSRVHGATYARAKGRTSGSETWFVQTPSPGRSISRTGDPDSGLTFALHEEGHSIPKGWAQMAVDWFEALR